MKNLHETMKLDVGDVFHVFEDGTKLERRETYFCMRDIIFYFETLRRLFIESEYRVFR